ncbi:hypothetical protein Tsumi_09760 [Porphyromonas miyakawae]|uniref:Uncharacterized protein n=1 Tax=Porphyromonas miyakawae TaxID=3137470 RepID=A0ABQ0E2F1_9PORP
MKRITTLALFTLSLLLLGGGFSLSAQNKELIIIHRSAQAGGDATYDISTIDSITVKIIEPEDGNLSYMFPSYEFGKPFNEGGPIWLWEKARGYDTEYLEDIEWGNSMKATPNKETPVGPLKVNNIFYYDIEYGAANNYIYKISIVSYSEAFPSDPGEGKMAELMSKIGFKRAPEKDYVSGVSGKKISAYINAEKLLLAELSLDKVGKGELALTQMKEDETPSTPTSQRKLIESLRAAIKGSK